MAALSLHVLSRVPCPVIWSHADAPVPSGTAFILPSLSFDSSFRCRPGLVQEAPLLSSSLFDSSWASQQLETRFFLDSLAWDICHVSYESQNPFISVATCGARRAGTPKERAPDLCNCVCLKNLGGSTPPALPTPAQWSRSERATTPNGRGDQFSYTKLTY